MKKNVFKNNLERKNMNRTNIIEINHLSKTFKDVKAVDDLSFVVKTGELFAFLGLNGAGKSTTISIMCGQLTKDQGEVLINGKNVDTNLDDVKRSLGVVFQNSVLDGPLSVYDNLYSRVSLYGLTKEAFEKKLDELAEILDFKKLLKRPYGKLSGGQKRKIDIARALFHDPKVLILDEPTTGLDPQTRKMVWEVIHKLRKERGITVFLTTHYMEEASDADYVIILDSGKIVAKGSPLELKNQYTGDFITFYNTPQEEVAKLNLPLDVERGFIRVEVENPQVATKLIATYPEVFVDYEITKGKMDDVFLAATGKKLGGN